MEQKIKKLNWSSFEKETVIQVEEEKGFAIFSYQPNSQLIWQNISETIQSYLLRLAKKELTGIIKVETYGQVSLSTIYNGCYFLCSFYHDLSTSLVIENEDLCVGFNDYGDLTECQMKTIQTMPEWNENLAILSQQYNQIVAQWNFGKEKGKMTEKEIVIATKNKGKAKEFADLFGEKGYTVKTLLDFPEIGDIAETGSTFTENALQKAQTIADLLQRPVLADDSGLCVDALHGKPGIYSARFAKDHDDAANNAKLLSELAGVPALERTAHFHCTLAFAAPHKEPLIVEGEVEGLIHSFPEGENGFGYDPLFYLPELDCTMAQLSPEQKNQLSHRAVALKRLEKVWEDWMNETTIDE